jgi:hypothetical protein
MDLWDHDLNKSISFENIKYIQLDFIILDIFLSLGHLFNICFLRRIQIS